MAAHEQAHARCRDPLTHVLGRLLAGLIPRQLGQPLLEGWLDQAEQRADQAAARASGDPLAVARLLLRQARQGDSPSLVPAFAGGRLELRVRALLAAPTAPPRLTSDLGPGLALVLGALLLVGLFGFQIHATLEHLLQL